MDKGERVLITDCPKARELGLVNQVATIESFTEEHVHVIALHITDPLRLARNEVLTLDDLRAWHQERVQELQDQFLEKQQVLEIWLHDRLMGLVQGHSDRVTRLIYDD